MVFIIQNDTSAHVDIREGLWRIHPGPRRHDGSHGLSGYTRLLFFPP